ncbi:Leucine Rich Repeat [Seminavis robusta]|uniref:Leucine Rich Repeat n=1 Tax=Seminavis robusta TaxID=568900 RepID=A0A9N8E9M3_9STRA|nr:Leucine Rich Repeat [Seminavis robusta]|eukprot:Sro647_g180970.1 Leucine Rich Repeat (640) ;mRNA; r:44202-46121
MEPSSSSSSSSANNAVGGNDLDSKRPPPLVIPTSSSTSSKVAPEMAAKASEWDSKAVAVRGRQAGTRVPASSYLHDEKAAIDLQAKAAAMLVLDHSSQGDHSQAAVDEEAATKVGSAERRATRTQEKRPQRLSSGKEAFRSMPLAAKKDESERVAMTSTGSQPLTSEEVQRTVLRRVQICQMSRLPGAFRVAGIGGIDADDRTVSKPFSVDDSFSSGYLGDPLHASLVFDVENGATQAGTGTIALEDVLEVPAETLPDQESDDADTKLFSRKFLMLLKVVSLLWVVAFTIGLLMMNHKSFSSSPLDEDHLGMRDSVNEQTNDKQEETDLHYLPFDEDLPTATIEKIQGDTSSPQYKANAWLSQDPSFQLYSPFRKQQRFAMAVHYFATGGETWLRNDDWLSYNVSECHWYSRTRNESTSSSNCDEQGRVILQELSENNLSGLMEQEAQLPNLRRIDYSSNGLHGMLPVFSPGELCLREFILSNNRLAGPIRVSAGMTAPKLRVVKLDGNQFEGNIHVALPLFPKLEVWNVTDNKFEGTVPSEVQNTPNLTYLGLGHNHFYGSVPSELGLLSSLQNLDLSGNQGVTGALPAELAHISSTLEVLDISGTSVTGEIPEELCLRQKAGDLVITANCSLVRCCE